MVVARATASRQAAPASCPALVAHGLEATIAHRCLVDASTVEPLASRSQVRYHHVVGPEPDDREGHALRLRVTRWSRLGRRQPGHVLEQRHEDVRTFCRIRRGAGAAEEEPHSGCSANGESHTESTAAGTWTSHGPTSGIGLWTGQRWASAAERPTGIDERATMAGSTRQP